MGLLDLFRKTPPRRLEHAVLGALVFDARFGTWQREAVEETAP